MSALMSDAPPPAVVWEIPRQQARPSVLSATLEEAAVPTSQSVASSFSLLNGQEVPELLSYLIGIPEPQLLPTNTASPGNAPLTATNTYLIIQVSLETPLPNAAVTALQSSVEFTQRLNESLAPGIFEKPRVGFIYRASNLEQAECLKGDITSRLKNLEELGRIRGLNDVLHFWAIETPDFQQGQVGAHLIVNGRVLLADCFSGPVAYDRMRVSKILNDEPTPPPFSALRNRIQEEKGDKTQEPLFQLVREARDNSISEVCSLVVDKLMERGREYAEAVLSRILHQSNDFRYLHPLAEAAQKRELLLNSKEAPSAQMDFRFHTTFRREGRNGIPHLAVIVPESNQNSILSLHGAVEDLNNHQSWTFDINFFSEPHPNSLSFSVPLLPSKDWYGVYEVKYQLEISTSSSSGTDTTARRDFRQEFEFQPTEVGLLANGDPQRTKFPSEIEKDAEVLSSALSQYLTNQQKEQVLNQVPASLEANVLDWPGTWVGTKLPSLELQVLSTSGMGSPFDQSTLIGKPSILFFTGSGCPPCKQLKMEMQKSFLSQLELAGIPLITIEMVRNSTERASAAKHPTLGVTNIMTAIDVKKATQFGIHSIPDILILDATGTIVFGGSGFKVWNGEISGFQFDASSTEPYPIVHSLNSLAELLKLSSTGTK